MVEVEEDEGVRVRWEDVVVVVVAAVVVLLL